MQIAGRALQDQTGVGGSALVTPQPCRAPGTRHSRVWGALGAAPRGGCAVWWAARWKEAGHVLW